MRIACQSGQTLTASGSCVAKRKKAVVKKVKKRRAKTVRKKRVKKTRPKRTRARKTKKRRLDMDFMPSDSNG